MSADGGTFIETGWTARRVALLVDHYKAGLSAAESAVLLGGTSKNAVVSKRRRLGLLATAPMGSSVAADHGFRRLMTTGRIRRLRGPPPLPTSPLPDMEGPLPPDARRRSLVERGFGECAWPLGPAAEAGSYRTLFCGAPIVGCSRYCDVHAARAYQRCDDDGEARS